MSVNRETAIAITIGFTLGFLAASSIFFLPQLRKRPSISDVPDVMRAGKSNPSPVEQLIRLAEPEEQFGTTQGEIAVSGQTKALARIIVSSELGDTAIEAKSDGSFKTTINLPEGASEIWLTVIADDLAPETIKRSVYFIPDTANQNDE